MATFDLTASNLNHPAYSQPVGMKKLSKVFDASKQALAQNDLATLMNVKAGWMVVHAAVNVLTVDANAGTFAIGDGGSATGYFAAVNQAVLGQSNMGFAGTLGGTGAFGDPVVITGYSAGEFYAAAGVINLKALGASGMTTGKVEVTIWYIDTNERS